jgi:hypothetical protein
MIRTEQAKERHRKRQREQMRAKRRAAGVRPLAESFYPHTAVGSARHLRADVASTRIAPTGPKSIGTTERVVDHHARL